MAAALLSAACGKKGPPLAPIVHIPGAVEHIEARRVGDEVTVTVTVPSKNIDGSMPIDIGRIEVYGYTGTAVPPTARFLEVATLVGTVTVVSPPTKDTATPAAPAKPGDPIPGGPTSIVESLTPDALVAKAIPPQPTTRRQPRPLAPVGPAADVEAGPLRRFYFALAFSPGGRPGPPGAVAELHLTELPEAPLAVKATHVADAVRVEWEPSGGLIGFLLDRPIPSELSPLDNPPVETGLAASTAPPDGPTRYNVYREIAAPVSDPVAAAKPAGDAELASPKPPGEGGKPSGVGGPINAAPLETLVFFDPLTGLDARERCYVVRSVRGVGAQAVESNASEPSCVVPLDDFPPEPPAGLSTISGEGSITLIWEPNAEPDVAGYLVLRGEAGDATLAPLTDTVVTEARYTDRTVKPGVRYVYAVQAIDTRLPRPNVSGESARVEDVAR
jgi:hypothetical protein